MKARPTQSRKGVKGQLPLAGSRDSVPCGVWGNAPTVPRATIILNALNKGAGSEASLPVTLRVRRRAPKLLFPQVSVKNRIRRRESAKLTHKKPGDAPCGVPPGLFCDSFTASVRSWRRTSRRAAPSDRTRGRRSPFPASDRNSGRISRRGSIAHRSLRRSSPSVPSAAAEQIGRASCRERV